MKQKQTIPPASGRAYVTKHGNLCMPFNERSYPKDRGLNLQTTIQVVTGLDHEALYLTMAWMAVDWLADHTGCTGDIIAKIMEKDNVLRWWQDQWEIRDGHMIYLLVDYHEREIMKAMRRHPRPSANVIREVAQEAVMKKYIRLHKMAFIKNTWQYKRLEDSYARLW